MAALAERLGVACVATGNVHAHTRERALLQDAFVAIREHTTLDASEPVRRGNHAHVLTSPEAMAAGVPTLGTRAGGVRELVTHGADGLLVPPRDPPALARAILSLVENPGLARALSDAGPRRVRESFHAARGAETLCALAFGPPDDVPPMPAR